MFKSLKNKYLNDDIIENEWMITEMEVDADEERILRFYNSSLSFVRTH